MSTNVNSDREADPGDDPETENPLLGALLAIRRSAVLFTTLFGLALIAIGMSPFVTGVFAGMFGVWGATAVVCAVLGFIGVQALQLFDN